MFTEKSWDWIKRILFIFIIWRLGLFVVAFFSSSFIPNFGARFPYYDTVLTVTNLPGWVWGFGNFDGVHYLKIASLGYVDNFQQAFFPVYPIIIHIVAKVIFLLPGNITQNPERIYFLGALFVSNIAFIGLLGVYYKLIRLDFNTSNATKSIILLILFPTAFYFSSVYTESIFFLLVVSSLYFIRKKEFIIAGILALFASATRITGVLLVIPIYMEWRNQLKQIENTAYCGFLKGIIGITLAPVGLLLYMLFLYLKFYNPLYFLTSQPAFGAQRSALPFVLLPQVIVRYIKMLLSVPVFSLSYLNIVLELLATFIPLVLLFLIYKNIKKSYLWFILSALILPTLTGTLSSMPRYSLVIFLIFPYLVNKYPNRVTLIYIASGVLQAVLLTLFIRGYWVA